MDMTTATRRVAGGTIVDIRGRIALGKEGATLRELVSRPLSDGHKKILLHLADVSYIDSSGLGHLVSAYMAVRNRAGELKLLKGIDRKRTWFITGASRGFGRIWADAAFTRGDKVARP